MPTRVVLDALRADGPHPNHSDALMLFGRFVGSWDVQVRFYDERASVTYDESGTWSFGWVLDGRAIQDVLITPNYRTRRRLPGERGIGTTLRYLEPGSGQWRVVWLGAVTGILLFLTARQVGDEMWIEGPDADGSDLRWIFSGIQPDRFHWKGLTSRDGGRTWRLEQEIRGSRMPSA